MSTVPTKDVSVTFPTSTTAATVKYFRNAIAAPAPGGFALGDRMNTLLARRLRQLFSYTNVYGLHANFDSASTSDLACYRMAFHTGPVTTKIRWVGAFLPILGSPSAADVTAYLTLTTGLTGTGTDSTTTISVPYGTAAAANLSADDLIWLQADITVTADSFYRATLHRTNLARMVSSVVYEIVPLTLNTDTYSCVNNTTTYYQSAPITQSQVNTLNLSADMVWRRGHPLGWWSTDIPGDERSRTSATAANLWDQTAATPTSTTPGWPVSVPYSGSLDSANVPVICWAYADCVGGSGTITFRDQNNATIGTITAVGAADWYAVTGNLTDNTDGAQTTKVDVFFGGDGVNACKVYACGLFMHASDDAIVSSSTAGVAFTASNSISNALQSMRDTARRRRRESPAYKQGVPRRPFT